MLRLRQPGREFRGGPKNLWPGVRGSRNPRQDASEGAWIATDLGHQSYTIPVGCGFDAARIASLQNGFPCEHYSSAPNEITEQHSEQQGETGALQDRSGPVAMCHMSDLVGNYGGELVRRAGFIDQPLENIDMPPGKRDGIRFRPAHDRDLERQRQ